MNSTKSFAEHAGAGRARKAGKKSKRRHPSHKQNLPLHYHLYEALTNCKSNQPVKLDEFSGLLGGFSAPRALDFPHGWYDCAKVGALLLSISYFCETHPSLSYDDHLELMRLLLQVPKRLRLSHSDRQTFEMAATPWPQGSNLRHWLDSLLEMENTVVATLLFGSRVSQVEASGGGLVA